MKAIHLRERLGAAGLSIVVIVLSATAVPDYVSRALAIERLLPWARRHPETMRFIDGRPWMDWFGEVAASRRSGGASRPPTGSDLKPPMPATTPSREWLLGA